MKKIFEKLFGKKHMEIEDSVSGYLKAIDDWLSENAKSLKDKLHKPESEDVLSNIESELGIVIPSQVREAYLIHGGETSDSNGIFGLWRWLSIEDMKNEFKHLKEHKDSDAIRIPILLSPGGDLTYVESGKESAIIDWWHENPTRDVKHSDFKAYLNWFTKRLYSGEYVYLEDEITGLIDKSELYV